MYIVYSSSYYSLIVSGCKPQFGGCVISRVVPFNSFFYLTLQSVYSRRVAVEFV